MFINFKIYEQITIRGKNGILKNRLIVLFPIYTAVWWFSAVQSSSEQCIAVHCIAVHCSALQSSALQCIAEQCILVHCRAVHFSALQSSALQRIAEQCSEVQFDVAPCSAVQCRATVQCSVIMQFNILPCKCAVGFLFRFW